MHIETTVPRWDHSLAMGQRNANGLGRNSTRHIYAESHNGSTATKPGAAAQKSVQNKIDKYSKLASTHIFYPFAIETAGTWHEMAIELTQEIGRRITTITEDTWETTFLFQRRTGKVRQSETDVLPLCYATKQLTYYMAVQRGNAVSFHNTMVTE